MKKVKLMIGVPSTTMVHADFATCLGSMLADLCYPIENIKHQYVVMNVKTSILPKSREKLAEAAVQNGATHILFLDSDMTFPQQTARELLKYDFPVVAANCPTKTFPSNPTARLHDPQNPAGQLLHFDENSGLTRVWRVGTGVMLIDTKVFSHMPKPWFNTRWDIELQDHVGEDWVFCENLQAAGIPIYVDQELSVHIGHIGSYTFTHNDCESLVRIETEIPK